MTFGQMLKDLRIQIGKSQAKVAEEMSGMFPDFSISQTYLSALEKRDSAPREEILEILAEYYGVDVTYFFNETTQEDKRRGVNLAKSRLRQLKVIPLNTGQAYARSEGFRTSDDDVSDSLNKMRDRDEDRDF